MFVPYSSDALLLHRPRATLAIIAVNIALFAAIDALAQDARWIWTLQLGRFLPWQWVTYAFSHAGLWHLIGNMAFLWTFGLIVEGKLGWRRFLALYLGMAAAEGFVVQLISLGADPITLDGVRIYPPALGASGVVMGLMMVSLVWAPKNDVRCVLVLFPLVYRFELPVLGFCAFYLGIDLLGVMLSGFAMGTSLLHVIGAATGVAPAILLLRYGIVDCEGWDLLSLRERRRLSPRRLRSREIATAREDRAAPRPTPAVSPEEALRVALHEGDASAALAGFRAWSGDPASAPLDGARASRLVAILAAAGRFEEAHHAARTLRDRQGSTPALDLEDARILADELRRPAAALGVLARLEAASLTESEREEYAAIADRAHTMREDGVLEFLD